MSRMFDESRHAGTHSWNSCDSWTVQSLVAAEGRAGAFVNLPRSLRVPPSPRLPLPLVAPTKSVFVLLFTPCLAWIRKQPTPADGRVIRDGGSTCKPLKPCDLAPMPQPESAASTAPRVEGRGLRKSFSVDFYQSSGWKARFDRPASFVDLNSIRARRRHVGGVAIHCRF